MRTRTKFEKNFPYINVILLLQVVTVKRLCVKKLPPVLAIQLKRFEYDYERVCAIKFNDYFEFPRILDMEPYTGEKVSHSDVYTVSNFRL